MGDTDTLVAAILNAAWMVRHYARGSRLRRQQAILKLGITTREALNHCGNDFEAILRALAEGLNPRDDPPF